MNEDFGFTDEQLMLRDAVRKFVREQLPEEYVRECDQKRLVPWEAFHKIAEMGWLGVMIPEKYGGSGLGFVELAIILEELAYGFFELSLMVYRAAIHGASALLTYGTETQREKYLPQIVEGKFLSSLSLTEPNAGSDAASIQTRAVQDGDYFIINGQKIFNSQVDIATRTILVTRTNPNVPKHKGITLFFVNPHSPGVEIHRLETLCSRSVGTNQVFYNNVRVHKDDMLGELDKGWQHLMTSLNKERFSIAPQATGAAQSALDTALKYAKERVQFNQPIGKFQAIQHMLADMQIDVHLCRLLTYQLARKLDNGIPCNADASIAKVFATEAYHRVADKGMQILGGYSMTPDFPMERHYRESRITRIAGGSNEVMRNSIAKDLGL